VILAAALLGAIAPAAAQIAPHRAAYTITLGGAREGSGIASAQGVMVFDWQQLCEGWTLTQRMTFRLVDTQGQEINNDVSFSSFEAKDGLSYRFDMRTQVDSDVTEELRGRASLSAPGQGGRASFVQPDGEAVELPPGTMFPTEHARLLINAARAGERELQRFVFDGATLDGAFDTNAVISAPAPPDGAPTRGEIDAALLSLVSWRVRIAYFKAGDENAGAPEYEISMRMFANGVGTDFLFEYGDFSLRADLERLERLPQPTCD
jgi:hypothetical protein